jgi:peptide-methionine (S)-S-oxide reductase
MASRSKSRTNGPRQKATFAAGCFWGVEEAFNSVNGVVSATVGYTGGKTDHPGYEEVSSGRTGHAESVEVTFDPAVVTYEELLDVFWEVHDPTTRNRQGPDIGSQYRSVIFYHDDRQKEAAEASKEWLERTKHYRRPIVTEIVPASTFYPAEEYHQHYLRKRGFVHPHL